MATVDITNPTGFPVKKYGTEFGPNETIAIDTEILNTYSNMEISRALQYMVHKMDKIKLEPVKIIEVKNFPTYHHWQKDWYDPWIVRKYREYKENKKSIKRMKELKANGN